jgi:hypothetical protein
MCQGLQVLVRAHIVTYSQSNFHYRNDVCVHFMISKSFAPGQVTRSTNNDSDFIQGTRGNVSLLSRNDVYVRKSLLHSQLMLIQGEFTFLINNTQVSG